jgi:hypothetical protein
MIRWVFRLPATASPWTDSEAVRFTRSLVADLRAAYARYPARHPMIKRVDHPLTGPLEFECQVLHIPDTGQRLITYCAAPGSPTQADPPPRQERQRSEGLGAGVTLYGPEPFLACYVAMVRRSGAPDRPMNANYGIGAS